MKLTLVPKDPIKFRGETGVLDFDGSVIPRTPIRFELGTQDDHPDAPRMGVCLDTSFLARNENFQRCVLSYMEQGDAEFAGQIKCMANEAAAHAADQIASSLFKPVLFTTAGVLLGSLGVSYLLRRKK